MWSNSSGARGLSGIDEIGPGVLVGGTVAVGVIGVGVEVGDIGVPLPAGRSLPWRETSPTITATPPAVRAAAPPRSARREILRTLSSPDVSSIEPCSLPKQAGRLMQSSGNWMGCCIAPPRNPTAKSLGYDRYNRTVKQIDQL
jgi:hypothetical protein